LAWRTKLRERLHAPTNGLWFTGEQLTVMLGLAVIRACRALRNLHDSLKCYG
jgi:hypothetical protein